jgi:hypothetical protein
MQLGFVMQADAAPHDDWRFWPDVVDHLRGRRPRTPGMVYQARNRVS